jgi:hypothetical protein
VRSAFHAFFYNIASHAYSYNESEKKLVGRMAAAGEKSLASRIFLKKDESLTI